MEHSLQFTQRSWRIWRKERAVAETVAAFDALRAADAELFVNRCIRSKGLRRKVRLMAAVGQSWFSAAVVSAFGSAGSSRLQRLQ
jgi:hypothetical protein